MGEKVFTLRMDEELFEKVKNVADKNKRSIAKEIEYQLEQSLSQDNYDVAQTVKDFIDQWSFKLDDHDYELRRCYEKVDEILELVKK